MLLRVLQTLKGESIDQWTTLLEMLWLHDQLGGLYNTSVAERRGARDSALTSNNFLASRTSIAFSNGFYRHGKR